MTSDAIFLTKACCREVEGGVLLDCPNPGVAHAIRIATERSHAFNRYAAFFQWIHSYRGIHNDQNTDFSCIYWEDKPVKQRDCQTLSRTEDNDHDEASEVRRVVPSLLLFLSSLCPDLRQNVSRAPNWIMRLPVAPMIRPKSTLFIGRTGTL